MASNKISAHTHMVWPHMLKRRRVLHKRANRKSHTYIYTATHVCVHLVSKIETKFAQDLRPALYNPTYAHKTTHTRAHEDS